MRTSAILFIIAPFIVAAAMSVPAGSKPAGGIASKATTEKCKKVGEECLNSPLCLGGITKQNCITRCINKQSQFLRSGSAATKSATEGKGGGKREFRAPIAKPTVQQPTSAVAPNPIPRGRGGTGHRK